MIGVRVRRGASWWAGSLAAVAVATLGGAEPRPAGTGPGDGDALLGIVVWPDSLPEATSLLGTPLLRPALPPEQRADHEAKLASALADLAARPDDPGASLWVGRRLAYLGRTRDAIAVYTRALELWPDEPRLLRHRGHRYITVRDFVAAVTDLERAAHLVAGRADEVEPDGLPNAFNIPTSTLHTNIWYHLGLAHFLRGDFAAARRCFEQCLRLSQNDDMVCAASDWLYMTLRRLGRDAEAKRVLEAIHADMRILENHAYHRRLRLYQGALAPDSLLASAGADAVTLATQGFGVGHWYLTNGERERARAIFESVVAGTAWAAFGHIAAEAELARMRLGR